MNRYFLWLVVFLLGSPVCIAQRVIYSSQMIREPYEGVPVKKIRPHWSLSPTITVKYTDGRKQAIAKDSIWGYEDRRGRLYRYYKREFYRVDTVSNLVRYTITRHVGRGLANARYFSRDLDSPLRWTKAKARRDSSEAY